MKITLASLFFLLTAPLAWADIRADLVDRIQTAVRDPLAENDLTGPGWTLYPPLNRLQFTLEVDHCTLIVTAHHHEGLSKTVRVDLSVAHLSVNNTGTAYEYLSNREETGDAMGSIGFELPHGQTFTATFTATFSDPLGHDQATQPWTEQHDVVPILLGSMSSPDRIISLTRAILDYQKAFCRPIG